jgi:hypothetical protein
MGSSDSSEKDPPTSVFASLTKQQVEDVLDPWARFRRELNKARRFYLAVKRLIDHEGMDCKECSYGDSGHCLPHEKLRLKVWKLIQAEEKRNGKRKRKSKA